MREYVFPWQETLAPCRRLLQQPLLAALLKLLGFGQRGQVWLQSGNGGLVRWIFAGAGRQLLLTRVQGRDAAQVAVA